MGKHAYETKTEFSQKLSMRLTGMISKNLRTLPIENRAKVINALERHLAGEISDSDLSDIYYDAILNPTSVPVAA